MPDQDCRGDYAFECTARDCGTSFDGDDLAMIARRAARHWNKEHGSDLRHNYEPIDVVEFGGHHLHGHAYEVKKYTVYVTAFDMMQRLGQIDGFLAPSDRDTVCTDCWRQIPNDADRIEDAPDDIFSDDWTCRACLAEAEIDRKASENQQITDWQ